MPKRSLWTSFLALTIFPKPWMEISDCRPVSSEQLDVNNFERWTALPTWQNTAQPKIGVSALRGAELRRELLCLGDRSLVLAVRLSHHVAVRRSRDLVV